MLSRCSYRYNLIITALLLPLLLTTGDCWSYDRTEGAGDVALVAVAAAAGGVSLWQKDLDGLIQLVQSGALDLTVTYGLKYAVSERRPNGEDNQSFPSAHSSVAFTSAEYLRKRYGLEYGLPAYAAASFIAYSRVEAKKHYLHDVLAGAAIGTASSFIFTNANPAFIVTAEAAPGYYGVRLSQSW